MCVEPNYLSLTLDVARQERTNSQELSSGLYTCAVAHTNLQVGTSLNIKGTGLGIYLAWL